KLGQALAENNLSGAAGCYQKIAEQWQLLGELEGHKDMRKFYFHKALDLYQKASKYADIIDLENVANLQQWLSIIESKSHKTNTHYFLPSHLPLQVQTNFANNTDSTESSRLLPSLSSG
ncbi:MAG: hypothetical protein K0S11_1892, partial [Gammaproteobacteria bacterium]|nr:hypothetical protein [Gammaproteobacteria bacterium]